MLIEPTKTAPEKAKKRHVAKIVDSEEPTPVGENFFRIDAARWADAEEVESKVDRYLNRNTTKACEVWVEKKLAYRVYGSEHPRSQKPKRKQKPLQESGVDGHWN